MKNTIVSLLSLAAATLASQADIKLPAIFSDHMVLQRDAKVPVWGWADPGEKITVSIAGQEAGTTTDKNGRWHVDLEPMIPGQTHILTVKGKNTVTAQDVLIGDVWLGSGQSNMAMRVASSNDYDKEKQEANHPGIRMFTVSSGTALNPATDCRGKWAVCSPDTVGGFSATAYFFGRELHARLKIPIGLINSSVGGTPIEAWISRSAQHAAPRLTKLISQIESQAGNYDPAADRKRHDTQLAAWNIKAAAAKKNGKRAPRKPRTPQQPQLGSGYPGALFNGKINPLVPFALKGGIWYQGERNSVPTGAGLYRHQLPVLIKDWRTRWGQGDFPFAWVQLPNYETATRDWPTIRESMLVSLKVPNTGMAITIDVGDPKDIHPKNKQAVGRRLAAWALGKVYGLPVATSGPIATKHRRQGSGIVVSFNHTNGGLSARGAKVTGFELSDAQGKWHPATAKIEGESVIVTSLQVKAPAAVRYAWANNPVCNLYNGAGLPASPFRLGAR